MPAKPPPQRVLRRRRSGLVLLVLVIMLGSLVIVLTGGSSGASGGTALDPAAFAAGACIAFEPTSGDRHQTVFLDAGHGGTDPGGVGTTDSGKTIEEADETLPVELEVATHLRADGYRVVVSRTRDTTVLRLGPGDISGGVLTLQGAHDDVAARDQCANDANAAALVGIYYDASSSSQTAGSLTAYDPDRSFASSNQRLATLLQTDVLAAMNVRGWNIPDDGVQSDSALGSYVGSPSSGGIAGEAAAYDHLMLIGPAMSGFFSTPSLMPGAVIEPLYLTDPFEGSIADSASGQSVIAQGMATAIEQYLNPSSGAGPSGS
ncbi:MAG TPA: N-acetylmuramoyl-L-alanine amidase [Acidimicrobiales bacterium]|nr:N-acetylmuramoyl-L-alanine amidase [Acidimicrobiales bacterium]